MICSKIVVGTHLLEDQLQVVRDQLFQRRHGLYATEIPGPATDLLFAEPDNCLDWIAAQPKLSRQGNHIMFLIQSAHYRNPLTAS